VVSVGTSAPELAVALVAVFQGSPDLAVGNILGSNLANIGLVLGIAALVRPLEVRRLVIRREVPWMIVVTVLAFPLIWDLHLGRLEGTILALVLGCYLYLLLPAARAEEREILVEQLRGIPQVEVERPQPRRKLSRLAVPFVLVLAGSVGLVVGAQGIVRGGVAMAEALGVSELLIGFSVVAVGTSLPELATTVVDAIRGEADLAVGNIVGSNIFNLTFVLGGTALAHPLPLQPHVLQVEYPAVLVLSFLLLPLVSKSRNIGRKEGLLFLTLYAVAWVWIWWMGG
jgi:cation:H+ antiporter